MSSFVEWIPYTLRAGVTVPDYNLDFIDLEGRSIRGIFYPTDFEAVSMSLLLDLGDGETFTILTGLITADQDVRIFSRTDANLAIPIERVALQPSTGESVDRAMKLILIRTDFD